MDPTPGPADNEFIYLNYLFKMPELFRVALDSGWAGPLLFLSRKKARPEPTEALKTYPSQRVIFAFSREREREG